MLLAIALYSVVLPVSNLAQFGPIGRIVGELEWTTNGWVAPQLVYLLPQVFLQASRVLQRGPALVVALLVSSSLFVLSHVPRLLVEEVASGGMADELYWIFPWGLMLAVVFLVTRNLFLCVGLHSLWNARPTLIEVPWQTAEVIWWILTTALLLGWWLVRIYRARQNRAPSGP